MSRAGVRVSESAWKKSFLVPPSGGTYLQKSKLREPFFRLKAGLRNFSHSLHRSVRASTFLIGFRQRRASRFRNLAAVVFVCERRQQIAFASPYRQYYLRDQTRGFLAIFLILHTGLGAAGTFGQQLPDSREGAPNGAASKVQQLVALVDSKDPTAPAKIRQALSDESWYVRGAAARALGRLGDKTASSVLMPMLQDPNWFVRSAALEAIASSSDAFSTMRFASPTACAASSASAAMRCERSAASCKAVLAFLKRSSASRKCFSACFTSASASFSSA